MTIHRGLALSILGGDTMKTLLKNIDPREPRPFCGNAVPRKSAFLTVRGDPLNYRFGQQTWTSTKIPVGNASDLVEQMVEIIKGIAEVEPNVVLVQYYDGAKGAISWHADDEKRSMTRKDGKVLPIVSFSLGANVQFSIRPKEGKPRKTEKVILRHGDVLVMEYGAQELYEHAIMKGAISGERMSLTFRRQE